MKKSKKKPTAYKSSGTPVRYIGQYFLYIVIIALLIIYWKLLFLREILTHDHINFYGIFHNYIASLINGQFPYWNPYLLTGMHFYADLQTHGLLDPVVLLLVFFTKLTGISPLAAYIYLRLIRLLIFIVGAYFFFKHVTRCNNSAIVSALVLLLAIAPPYFRQPGMIETVYLTPFMIYFLINFFKSDRNRYFYLLLFVITLGISMNVYVPSYFLFNLVTFCIIAIIFGILKPFVVLRSLGKRLLPFSFIFLILAVSLSIPALLTHWEATDGKGELFSSLVILQKSDGMPKKIVASDLDEKALAEGLTRDKGVYSSYGNMLSLIYPDIWAYYFKDIARFNGITFKYNDFISEAFQYIGIIPFIFAVIGLIYSKSRWKWLALIMLVLISINLFNSGVHGRPPNILHKVFYYVFPPLEMINTKLNFSGFFLLYLCLLSGLGFKKFFNEKKIRVFADSNYRSLIVLCAAIVLIKIIATWFFFGAALYISNIDILAILMIAGFGIWIWLYHKNKIGQTLFYVVIFAAIIMDLLYYNSAVKRHTLSANFIAPLLKSDEISAQKDEFDFFRVPYWSGFGFGENIFKKKGALSRRVNHHVYTTRRYYDYLTHVPLENQMLLSGIVYPIVRFFPENKVKILNSKQETLSYISKAKEDELSNYLFLEKEKPSAGNYIFKGYDKFEDAPWLMEENVNSFLEGYFAKNNSRLSGIRNSFADYLVTPLHEINIKKFTENTLELTINNNVGGYLYYNDGWSRWWKAFDNGIEKPIKVANYNFKAIFLEKGNHDIQFVFSPSHYRRGLFIYHLSLVFALAASGILYYRGRKNATKN